MKLYHGSNYKIENFKDEFVGKGIDQHGPGIYFTTNPETAEKYGKFMYEVDCDINKILSDKNKATDKEINFLLNNAPNLEDTLTDWGVSPQKGLVAYKKAIFSQTQTEAFESIWYDFYRKEPIEYVRNVSKLGYQAVKVEKDNETWFIVFNPIILKDIKKLKENKMCGTNKKCKCGCAPKLVKESPSYDKKITLVVTDPENTISELLSTIKKIGNQGHGFDIIVDPELKSENDEDGIKTEFYWDGDGSDKIKDITIEDANGGDLGDSDKEGLSESKLLEYNNGSTEIFNIFVKHYKLQSKLDNQLKGKFAGFSKDETDLNRKAQSLKIQAWDIARKRGFDTNEIMQLDKKAQLKAAGKVKMTESEEADYYENFAKQLRANGEKHGERIMLGKADAARNGNLVDGEIIENINEASKVNLKLSSNTKRDLIKKAKTALDAVYSIYDTCERLNIDNVKFINYVDDAFEGINEALTLLVCQNSVDIINKK